MRQIYNFWNEDVYMKEGLIWGRDASNVAKNTLFFLKNDSELLIEKKNKFLDIGCGYGRDCVFFFNNGLEVVGVDFSERAIDIAIKENPKINYMILDLINGLPFKDENFDICYSNAVFQWFDIFEMKNLADEIVRVTAKEGYIVIAIPIFDVPNMKYNENMIFSYNGTDLYRDTLFDMFYNCKKVKESIIKEYHEHGNKHEHDYYLLVMKKM